MSEWQPIETAPKDGTRILIARLGDDVGMDAIEITEWCVSRNYRYEPVEGTDLFRRIEENYDFWNGNGHRATHWMPLPFPPEPTP